MMDCGSPSYRVYITHPVNGKFYHESFSLAINNDNNEIMKIDSLTEDSLSSLMEHKNIRIYTYICMLKKRRAWHSTGYNSVVRNLFMSTLRRWNFTAARYVLFSFPCVNVNSDADHFLNRWLFKNLQMIHTARIRIRRRTNLSQIYREMILLGINQLHLFIFQRVSRHVNWKTLCDHFWQKISSCAVIIERTLPSQWSR